MEKLISILAGIRSDIDFTAEEALVDDGLLDSVDVLTIVTAIETEYGIKIPILQIVPENFNSATAMYALIQSLR